MSDEYRAPASERALEEGQAEGRAEGRIEGQAELIERMAKLKFGKEAVSGLRKFLHQVVEPERVVEISEWLIECQSDEELLERMGPQPGIPRNWEERLLEIWVEGEGSWRERGRAKGWSEGRLKGQREVIHRTTARKFGPDTAEELLRFLDRKIGPEQSAKIGELVITCKCAEELIDRAEQLTREEPGEVWERHVMMQGWEVGRAEGWISGRKAGRHEGRVEGRMELMHQVSEQKFGAETAEQLAERMEKLRRKDVTNLEHTRVVGEWIFECESGAELLDRVAHLSEPSTAGEGTAPT